MTLEPSPVSLYDISSIKITPPDRIIDRKEEKVMENVEFDLCMQRITCGDKDALHRIYDEYVDYIFHLVLGIVNNYEDAEDITSDFFIRLWKQAGMYKPGSGHRYYLSAIAHNMAVDYLRAHRREIPVDYQEEAEEKLQMAGEDPCEEVIAGISMEQLLARLKPSEREIVHLKIIGEQTFEKIASILHMPLGTVSWKYRQAIQKLRRYGYEA